MKEIKMTCPFTGVEFTALEYADGKIVVKHPLTNELLQVNWNCSIKKYNVPKSFFKHIETITPNETAELLNVSRQRVAQIIKDNVIEAHDVNGSKVFVKDDVIRYRDTRKAGRPWKKDE